MLSLSTDKQKESLQYNNLMPQPSIVHWHTGYRVPSPSDLPLRVYEVETRQLEQHKIDLVYTTNKAVAEASPGR